MNITNALICFALALEWTKYLKTYYYTKPNPVKINQMLNIIMPNTTNFDKFDKIIMLFLYFKGIYLLML